MLPATERSRWHILNVYQHNSHLLNNFLYLWFLKLSFEARIFTRCIFPRRISQIQVQPSVLPTSLYCTSTNINLHQYFDTVNVKAPGYMLPLHSPLPPVQFASFLVSPHDNARQVSWPRKYAGSTFYLRNNKVTNWKLLISAAFLVGKFF